MGEASEGVTILPEVLLLWFGLGSVWHIEAIDDPLLGIDGLGHQVHLHGLVETVVIQATGGDR